MAKKNAPKPFEKKEGKKLPGNELPKKPPKKKGK